MLYLSSWAFKINLFKLCSRSLLCPEWPKRPVTLQSAREASAMRMPGLWFRTSLTERKMHSFPEPLKNPLVRPPGDQRAHVCVSHPHYPGRFVNDTFSVSPCSPLGSRK